jgi:hypothetical protein
LLVSTAVSLNAIFPCVVEEKQRDFMLAAQRRAPINVQFDLKAAE